MACHSTHSIVTIVTIVSSQIVCETVPHSHLVSSTQDGGRLLATVPTHSLLRPPRRNGFKMFVAHTSSEMQREARLSRFAQKLFCSGVELVVLETANKSRV